MPVTRARLKNISLFDDVTINFCDGINVIIGENGTGKTHLLKAIYAFCETQANDDEKEWDQRYFYRFDKTLKEMFGKSPADLIKDEISACAELSFIYDGNAYSNEIWKNGDYSGVSQVYETEQTKDVIPAVFIPAKEFLTHSKGFMSLYEKVRMAFDKTYYDIIKKSLLPETKIASETALAVIPIIDEIIGGSIVVENDMFFIQKKNGAKIEFTVEAEGFKKVGLLWQLLMNDSINQGTILIWDEPEANINPKVIPQVVQILLELSRRGVQVFVATHDYITAKYFETKKNENDAVLFHSLYKSEHGTECESDKEFRSLKNNPITKAFDALMDEVIDRNLGE